MAMLASVPQMDSVRSLPRNHDVVARHASAEDLDAAQQLISSAQAGREHTTDRHRDEKVTAPVRHQMKTSMNGQRWPEQQRTAPPAEKTSTSPKAQKDTSFLGHSCRSVYLDTPQSFFFQVHCIDSYFFFLVIVGRKALLYGDDHRQGR